MSLITLTDFPSRSKSKSFGRGALIVLTLSALAVSASAQSNAGSFSSIQYSFSFDPNSAGNPSDLTVSDSSQVYNLILPFGSHGADQAYTDTSGSGTAFAMVNPSTGYDSVNWNGTNSISSRASETGPVGTASASVGSQENLRFTNSGTSIFTIQISALAQVMGDASITGPASNSNFANVDTYAGFQDTDLVANTSVNPFIHVAGSGASGVTTTTDGGWTPVVINNTDYYYTTYTLTIGAQGDHFLQLYASSKDITSASAVPEPSAVLALFGGVSGIFLKRRKKAQGPRG